MQTLESVSAAASERAASERAAFNVIAIVSSAGGLKALSAVLSALPADFPAAVVIVQHLSPRQPSLMAHILSRVSALPVKQAEEGDALRPGHVYLAAPDRHLIVNPDLTLSLTLTEKVHHVRPSGNVLFDSVSVACGVRAIALVLTGGDGDGASGIQTIKAAGGVTLTQDEASSEQFSMPRTAIATGDVDHVLTLDAIAPMLVRLVTAS